MGPVAILLGTIALILGAACTDAIPSAPSGESPQPTSELRRAAATMQEWLDRLESVELEIISIANPDEGPLKVTAGRDDRGGHALLLTPCASCAPSKISRSTTSRPWCWAATFTSVGMTSMVGCRARSTTSRAVDWAVTGLDRVTTVSWTELDDVSVVRRVWRGRRVWVIEYDADKDELGRFPDLVSGVSLGVNGMAHRRVHDPAGRCTRSNRRRSGQRRAAAHRDDTGTSSGHRRAECPDRQIPLHNRADRLERAG